MPDNFPPLKEVAKDVLLTAVVVGGGTGVAYAAGRIIKHFTGHRAAAKPVPPPTIDLTFADNALKDLTTELKLDPTADGVEGKLNRHRAYFIYRRVRDMGIANEALRKAPGLENLKQQVKVELAQVNKFLDEKLGTDKRGPYFGGGELGLFDPHHLDLGKFVSPHLTDPDPTTERDAVDATSPTVVQAQTLRELDRRKMRVTGIIFRAAALYPELWKGAGADSKLQTTPLTEILDRRLRTVERLHYEASAGATPDGIGPSFFRRDEELATSSDSSDTAGWFTDIRYRMFESPSMPRSTSFVAGLPISIQDVDANGDPLVDTNGLPVMVTIIVQTLQEAFQKLRQLVNDPGAIRFNVAPWYRNHLTDEFDWNIWPGTRMKLNMLTHEVEINGVKKTVRFDQEWIRVTDTAAARGYGWIMNPRRFATVAIKELFVTASMDLWDRSWLHSDEVMSALHIEALYFGLRRRKTLELHEKKSEDERKQAEQDLATLDAEQRQLELARQKPGISQFEKNQIDGKLSDIAKRERVIRGTDEELDATFNALATPDTSRLALDDYFEVRHRVVRAPNAIMKPGKTEHFENSAVPFDDLQIGDQVLFDSGPVLKALGSTNWEYPTVLVTEIDSFAPGVNIDPSKLTVQGFDSAELEQPSFQLLLARSIDTSLEHVRDHIERVLQRLKSQVPAGTKFEPPETLNWDPGFISQLDVAINDLGTLRFWNPYGDVWNDPGPWWIWINLNAPVWEGAFSGDVVKILGQTPGGIVWLGDKLLPEFQGRAELASTIPIGTGFQPPPWEDHTDNDTPTAASGRVIFVPLYQPDDGWISYFNAKARNGKVKRGPTLNPVVSDSAWLPGLARTGDKTRVIRPVLKPIT